MDYYSKPGLSYSMLKKLDEDAQEFYELYIAKIKSMPTSKAFEEGKMFDMILTEPERFNIVYGIRNGQVTFKGDISISMYTKLKNMVGKVNDYIWDIANQITLKEILAKGSFQEEIFWLDDYSFINCKGKLDWISQDKNTIIDFKTTYDSTFPAFNYSIENYKYYLQAGMYCAGIKKKYNLEFYPDYYLCAINKSGYHHIGKYNISHRIEDGISEMNRLLNLYNNYNENNWEEFK